MALKIPSPIGFLEKVSRRRAALDSERVVVDWSPSASFLVHLDLAGSPRIKHFQTLRFDDSTTDNEKRNAYQQFIKTCGFRAAPKAVVTWSDGMVFRQLTLPEMPQEDLLKAFAWDLKKKYYYEAAENLFGYEPVMDVETDEGIQKLFNIYYCENKAALTRLQFFAGLGFEILSLIPIHTALAKFASLGEPADRDTLLCDLSDTAARILVVRNGVGMLSRSVSLTLEEGAWSDGVLSKVAEELHKTADYYEGQRHARPIGRVLFTGAVETTRILDFMTSKFTFPVSVPDLGTASDSLPEEEKNAILTRSGAFAVSMGAVQSTANSLNLLPVDMKTKNRQKLMHHWLNIGLIMTALALAGVIGVTMLAGEVMKSHLTALEKEYEEINNYKKVFEKVISQSKVRRAARTGDIPVPAFLKDLSLRTPALISLLEIDYNRLEGTVLLRGEILEAKRETQKSVNLFATSLAESPFIESATVDSFNADEGTKRADFAVTCKVRGFA